MRKYHEVYSGSAVDGTLRKRCPTCLTWKPPSEFYKDARSSHGLMAECKPCFRARSRRFRKNHPETYRAYHEKNRPRLLEKMAQWKKENRPSMVRYMREWRERHPEEARRQENMARRLRRNKPLRAMIFARDGRCLCCSTTTDLVIDHILPIGQGGDNDPNNLQTLCRRCNSRKRGAVDYRRHAS